MSEDKLAGYRGDLRSALENVDAQIGDQIEVKVGEKHYKGSLMPRVETYDDWHLVIKLRSGYNIGLAYSSDTELRRLEQPQSRSLSLHHYQKPNQVYQKLA